MKKLLLLCCFLLCGCYNHKELNDLAICSAMGISYKDGEYDLSLQIVNTSTFDQKTSSDNAVFSVYNEKGATVYEAIDKISKDLSKDITLTQLKIIVIDESAITDNLDSLVDFLMNDLEISLNVLVSTTLKSTPYDILSVVVPNNEINGTYLSNLIEVNNSNFGNSYLVDLSNFFVNYLTDYNNIILTNIEIKHPNEDESNNDILKDTDSISQLFIDYPIVFNKDDVYKLSFDESIILNLVDNNINGNSLTFECDGGNFSVMIFKSKFGFDNFKNNNIYLKGNISGTVNEYNCSYDLDESDTLKKLQDIIKKEIYEMIDSSFDNSKNIKIDFLGVGKYLHYNYPDVYKKIDDVNTEISSFNVINKIDVSLSKQGNLRGDING